MCVLFLASLHLYNYSQSLAHIVTPAQKEWGGNAVGEGGGRKGEGSDMAGCRRGGECYRGRFQRREVLRGGGGIQGRLGEDESDALCGRRCARLQG